MSVPRAEQSCAATQPLRLSSVESQHPVAPLAVLTGRSLKKVLKIWFAPEIAQDAAEITQDKENCRSGRAVYPRSRSQHSTLSGGKPLFPTASSISAICIS